MHLFTPKTSLAAFPFLQFFSGRGGLCECEVTRHGRGTGRRDSAGSQPAELAGFPRKGEGAGIALN
jgi:hypothetical protein